MWTSRSGLWEITGRPLTRRPRWHASPRIRPSTPRRRGDGGAARGARLRRGPQHGHERRPRARRARRARRRSGLVDATASSSAGWTCRTSATSCTTSAGTPARPRCARPRRTRTSSAATCWCPGLRSSRIYVVDTKPDPRQPEDRQGRSRPRRSRARPATAARTRSTAARTGSTSARSARPTATGRAASSCWTTTTSRSRAQWEEDRGPQELAYDFWWHLGHDTMVTSEWGTPNMVEDGLVGELLLGSKYGHQLHVWDLREAQARAGARPRRRAPDGARAAPGARPAPRRYGFVGVVTSTADLSASVWLWHRADDGTVGAEKVIAIPAEPAEADQLPPSCSRSAPCRRWSPTSSCRVDDRVLYVSCWGTGELKRYDVSDPLQPARDRLGAAGRHRRARRAPGRAGR